MGQVFARMIVSMQREVLNPKIDSNNLVNIFDAKSSRRLMSIIEVVNPWMFMSI